MKTSRFLISLLFVVVLIQPVLLGLAPNPAYSLQQPTSTKLNEYLPDLERMEEPLSLPDILAPEVSLSAETPVEQDTPTKQTDDWTVMVYMCADNNLEEVGEDDINAMETIGSTADVNIVVGVDFSSSYYTSPFDGGRIYYIDYDTSGSIASTLLYSWASEPNFGDDVTLLYFINYAQTNYPANNYILVLWDHGGGWYGVCDDDSHGDILEMSELSTVLGDGSVLDIDIVAFDACLMGQIEVAYQVSSYCDYVVFSEESIPWEGYPYEYWLDDLTSTPSMSPATLSSTLVDRYCEAYDTGIYSGVGADDACLSSIQSSQITGVSGALDTFSDALDSTTTARAHYSSLSYCIGNSLTFSYPWVIDLGQFAALAGTTLTDATIAAYATSLASAVTTAVYAEEHLTAAAGATGLSIALEEYGTNPVALGADTKYDEFMDVFLSVGASTSSSLTPSAGYTYGFLEWTGDSVYFKFIPGASGSYAFTLSAMQNLGEDFDLFLYRGTTMIDSSESTSSTETVSGILTGGTTYYVRVYAYYACGAFRLSIPAGGTGGTGGGGGVPPFGPWFLILIALIVVVIVVVVIVVVCVVVRRRRARDTYSTSSTSSVRVASSPTGRVRCQHCFSIVPTDSSFCPICGNKV